jgi:hypothetical protein
VTVPIHYGLVGFESLTALSTSFGPLMPIRDPTGRSSNLKSPLFIPMIPLLTNLVLAAAK